MALISVVTVQLQKHLFNSEFKFEYVTWHEFQVMTPNPGVRNSSGIGKTVYAHVQGKKETRFV